MGVLSKVEAAMQSGANFYLFFLSPHARKFAVGHRTKIWILNLNCCFRLRDGAIK
jgi:hypothetical protein